MADTPGAFPVIGDTTTIRFKLGTLIGFIVGVIGMATWLTTQHLTLLQVQSNQIDDRKTLEHISRQIEEIHSIYFSNPQTNSKVSINP